MMGREGKRRELKLEWRDIAAIVVVVMGFLSIPFLVLILVVSFWGAASSIVKVVGSEDHDACMYLFFWTALIGVDLLVLYRVIRWHRS